MTDVSDAATAPPGTPRTTRGAAQAGAALLLALTAVGCTQAYGRAPVDGSGAAPSRPGAAASAPSASSPRSSKAAVPEAAASPSPQPGDAPPPGIGPAMGRHIPDDARQIVLVTGSAEDSSHSTAVLYERSGDGWQVRGSWPAHNALRGWTDDHRAGDLRSPTGVYSLTDAGGLMPDPGSKLPYHRSSQFTDPGTGFEGEPLAGVFDYVIAINYNRVQGTSPLDPRKPEGASRGGGIWLHLDHGGPSHGCVTLPPGAMLALLHDLDPARHPVIVMGDRSTLES